MSDETVNMEGAVCAPPLPHNEQIVMGHGAGGRMTHQLIQKAFLPAFDNTALRAGDDAAVLEPAAGVQLSISTDADVVRRCSSPAVTSVVWQCAARSMMWRCLARLRSI